MNANKVIATLFAEANPKLYNITHYLMSILLFITSVGLGMTWYLSLFLILAGFFFWLFLEYVIHRYVFHFKSKNATIRKLVYAMHGVHHAKPKDEEFFNVPLVPAVFLWFIIIALSYIIFGIYSFPLVSGTMLMHLYYNYIHYVIHKEKTNNKYLKLIKKNHMKHHHKDPTKNFGVTNVFFDKIFQTY